jgi:hypothetical protein
LSAVDWTLDAGHKPPGDRLLDTLERDPAD